jgi:zinc protease
MDRPRARFVTDVPQIAYDRWQLDNGLEVLFHADPTVPLVAVDVWYHVGSGDDPPGRSGFAHLFEHLMFNGSRHTLDRGHFERLRAVGATNVNGTTNTDRTNYYEVVPSQHLETALWLESDRMGFACLDQAALDKQRDVVRNERRQRYEDVAYGRERFAVAAALYPEGHSYRHLTIGRHEDIEAATLADVRAFWDTWYVPANATLCLAGDVERERARDLVAHWFGSLPVRPRPAHVLPASPSVSASRVEVADPLASRARLHYVWPAIPNLAPGDAALEVGVRVLGAGGWGRLFRRLVLELESAHAVSAWSRGMQAAGELHVVIDIKPGVDVTAVEAETTALLDAFAHEGPTAAEVARVAVQIESSFLWGLEELLNRAERMQYFAHYTGDPAWFLRWLEELRACDRDEVHRVVREVMTRARTLVITRPEGA